MKKIVSILLIIVCATLQNAYAKVAELGKAAPEFTLTDTHGAEHSLSEYAGKLVVLEWTNSDCPFVKKHYDKSGNIPNLQKEYTGKGVVWLSINSSAAGKQGNYPSEELNTIMKRQNASPTALLLDPDGEVGEMYGAKTTPHMYVIDPKGILIYEGAIDDKPTADAGDIKTAQNYVKSALEEAMTGKPVTTPSSQPYGCSVKYA